jgi:hypothetical protein
VIAGQVLGDDGKPADKVKVRAEILDGKIPLLVYPFAIVNVKLRPSSTR